MLNRIVFALFFLGLYSSGASLTCRWIDDKFQQHSVELLELLDNMAKNSTKDAAVENTVAFPEKLYNQTFNASAEDKLAFVVQILKEVATLFEEDYSLTSWEDSTVDNFLNVLNKQTDELSSCIGSNKKNNTKLRMYFKRLLGHILKKMGHSAAAWELIRTEVVLNLMTANQLATSLRSAN